MKDKWLIVLLAAVLAKGIIWLWLIPVFQVPDEPSHYSLVQFIAENKRRPHPRREVVTPVEVLKAAEAVNFSWQINHPVWRGYAQNWREQFQFLSGTDRLAALANDFQESLKRPAGYYFLATPFYWLGGGSFLGRFYAVRVFSLIMHLVTVWLVYLIAKKVFVSARLGLAAAALVGFQPMFSFISAGVHYDPLAILLATLFGWLMVNRQSLRALAAAIAGLLVKPDLIVLPLLWLGRRFWLGLIILLLLLAGLAGPADRAIVVTPKYDRILYLTNFNEYAAAARFFAERLTSGQIIADVRHYLAVTGKIHLAQIFPWYWGTFGWLEAPLPAPVFTVLKLIILVSFFGWIKYIHRNGFPRKMIFWLGFSWLQAGLVIANDFQFFTSRGEIYGIQGRYFFPAIVPHMILLIFGLKQWWGEKVLTKAIIGSSILLNLAGLITAYQYFGWVWGS